MFTLLRDKGEPTLLNLETEVTYLNLTLMKVKELWNMPLLSSLMDFKVISIDYLTEKARHNRSHMIQ